MDEWRLVLAVSAPVVLLDEALKLASRRARARAGTPTPTVGSRSLDAAASGARWWLGRAWHTVATCGLGKYALVSDNGKAKDREAEL